jgi:molybdopterin-guanine dinucleotide biosynthesis protein A
MTGIILSGGKNIRMGSNKAFLKVGGERLIDRTTGIFKQIFDEIILVTNSPLDYLDHDGIIATDIIKDKGALGGIYTGIFFASSEHAFISACDMPFLNISFIKHMAECAHGYDIVVPRSVDGLQPLHAVYSKKCLPLMKKLIDRNQLKITGFFRGLKTLEITEDVINSFDPEGRMFINVNTRGDFEQLTSC